MLHLVHLLLMTTYLAAPIVAGILAIKKRGRAAGRLIIALILGTFIGAGYTLLHARQVDARATFGNFTVACYLAIAMILIAKGFDLLLRKVLRIRIGPVMGIMPAFMGLLRVAILIVLGLPFVMSVAMVYRPKAIPRSDPMSQLQFAFERISFRSTDGVNLSGWWIPASEPTGRRRNFRPADFGAKTVLVCHGWGGNKATQLALIRQLVPAGYNALVFDFRGHGESDGQISTLGDLERRDVLGAVQWLKDNHPDQAKRIVGVGASMGAAALIAAATDQNDLGKSIEAIAVYGAYDDLTSLASSLVSNSISPPMDWLTARLGLSLASVYADANLFDFKPAVLVQSLWPRPILIIHATRDDLVPFDNGSKLFDAATFPKQVLWLTREDQDDAINDDSAADVVRDFFDTARPMPVI